MKKKLSIGNMFTYSIPVSYYRNNTGCTCDSICRCTTLEDAKVSDDNDLKELDYRDFDIRELYPKTKRYRKVNLSSIDKYCINRLIVLSGMIDKENFSVNVSSGYYGEEIGSITFDDWDSFCDDVLEVLGLSTDIEKVFYVLNKEYGYIAPIITNCTHVEIKKMFLKTDIFPSMGRIAIKKQAEYVSSIDYTLPIGIILKSNNTIVDGNHRLSYSIGKVETASYIVLS